MIALSDTTNAAAATKIVKLLRIVCTYPTTVVSCPIASALRLPTISKVITATRNSVLFFFSMLRAPTNNPKMNRTSKTVGMLTVVMKAARTAIINPTMNAHFPIKSNSMLYLFLVVNMRRKLFK